MKVLVANLGSTSFKYRLFEVEDDAVEFLSKGGYERVTDYQSCIKDALRKLVESEVISTVDDIEAVGFKTVLGHQLTGCVVADESVIDDLMQGAELAPAHNPPYAEGIRLFARETPKAQLVALFETAFYQWAKPESRRYAVPQSWFGAGVKRNGFHGASHKHIAERSAELLGRDDIARRVKLLYRGEELQAVEDTPLRVVSCHLGGSSSVTGILNGVAIDTSMGLSPQSGLPQNNRVGDLDAMAVTFVMKKLGLSLEQIEKELTKSSGLLGISGMSNDVRDIEEVAASGSEEAQIALDVLVYSIRHYVGAYAFQMGGLDAIVFTAGIGENSSYIRQKVCEGLEGFGLTFDSTKNDEICGSEACISAENSRIKVFVIPADEELVVARETYLLASQQLSAVGNS